MGSSGAGGPPRGFPGSDIVAEAALCVRRIASIREMASLDDKEMPWTVELEARKKEKVAAGAAHTLHEEGYVTRCIRRVARRSADRAGVS
jgi:hypothetical protein